MTQPALYEFLDRLLGEMASRFPDSIVSRTIIAGVWLAFFQECQQRSCGQMHTGGDEVSPSCWQNNSRIVTWLADHGMNSSELYPYFEEKVSAILRKHGKSMMAWVSRNRQIQSIPCCVHVVCHRPCLSQTICV